MISQNAEDLGTLLKRYGDKKVGPDGSRISKFINFYEKSQRGVGLSVREANSFYGICDYAGTAQIERCYAAYSLYNDEFTNVDVNAMCMSCIFHNKSGLYDENEEKKSIFDAFGVDDMINSIGLRAEEPYGAFVYFISDESDHIKIGVAKDPLKRLGNMQVGNAQRLKLLYLIGAKDLDAATRIENMLHNMYSRYKIRGEWYSIYQHMNHNSFYALYDPKDYLKETINERNIENI